MAIDIKMYLHDIAVSIRAIEQHISTVNSVEEFENNLLITDAIERRLSIIGEALNTADKQNPNLTITNKSEIISLRHLLVHHYNDTDYLIIWQIIHNHLPILKEEIEQLLND